MITHAEPGRPLLFRSSALLEPDGRGFPEALVEALYRRVLKRRPDAAGLRHYVARLQAGSTSAKEIVRDLMQSEEWAARFVQGRSVAETVLELYDCALARAPDVEGWNQLTSWEPRDGWGPVIDRMLDCPEYDSRFAADSIPGTVTRAEANLERS